MIPIPPTNTMFLLHFLFKFKIMQEAIDKILEAINECKDPIKNTVARNKRDAILDEIGL